MRSPLPRTSCNNRIASSASDRWQAAMCACDLACEADPFLMVAKRAAVKSRVALRSGRGHDPPRTTSMSKGGVTESVVQFAARCGG